MLFYVVTNAVTYHLVLTLEHEGTSLCGDLVFTPYTASVVTEEPQDRFNICPQCEALAVSSDG